VIFKEAFGALRHQQGRLLRWFVLEQEAPDPAERNKLICWAWHWSKMARKGNRMQYYLQRDSKFKKVLLKAQQK